MNRREFIATAPPGKEAALQLREALNGLFAQMRAAGGRPADFTLMTWTAARPALFHPSRKEIDLVYREVFGGFRPPIMLVHGGDPLQIRAEAVIARRGDEGLIWREYAFSELERQMSPRSAAVSMQAVFEEKRIQSLAFRAKNPDAAYDLAYGPGASEKFDVFYPQRNNPRPLWVFIHGGYWQASDKTDVHQLATQMLEAGFIVATPNYDLCAPATLRIVVEQMRRCMIFLYRNAAGFGCDPEQIHVAGASAGGHLAALLACDPKLGFIRSILPISGLLDLRPVSMLPAGRILGLDPITACELSPLLSTPNRSVRVGVAVGELESAEFRRQSSDLAEQWGGSLLEVKGRHHFNVSTDLIHGGPLADLALRIAGVPSGRTTDRP
jgi:arylformamidase